MYSLKHLRWQLHQTSMLFQNESVTLKTWYPFTPTETLKQTPYRQFWWPCAVDRTLKSYNSLSLSLSLSHTHTHALSLSLPLSLSLTHARTLSLSQTHTHAHSLSLSLSLYIYLYIYIYIYTHTITTTNIIITVVDLLVTAFTECYQINQKQYPYRLMFMAISYACRESLLRPTNQFSILSNQTHDC